MGRFRQALCASSWLTIAAGVLAAPAVSLADPGNGNPNGASCHLAPGVTHVIEIQFDNVHLRRDNPNVPSDLEQMPNLLNFMKTQGTLLTNHHTPLISHTADDIITTLTGTYGEKHGQPVANSYGFFRADGSVGFASSFAYWTDPSPDGKPNMIDPRGKVHPAPWVPFTRAGCDVGTFSMANIEFENVTSDVNNVFGPNSPQAAEAKANHNKAVADFEGIAIHCALNSTVCGAAGRPDLLPDEPPTPNGYIGFNALYGNVFVAPQITHGQSSVNDIDGNQINDGQGNAGFPGFDPSAAQTLGYLAQMLEAGVPVVYGYIADAHDNHFTFSGSYGPGEAGYVAQLAAYNEAFGKFFARLKADGITPDNTVFIITADENDHFVGQAGTPAGCDGVNTPCNYVRLPEGCDGDFTPCTTTNLGEVGVDLRSLLITETNGSDTTKLAVHSDDAPTVYVNGNPRPTDPTTRGLEHDLAQLVAFDPVTNSTPPLMQRMADGVEMSFLHMVTSDPMRTPTLVFFGNDDFFITASSKATSCTPLASCSSEQPGFNWNHGDFQRSITHTWLALAGPHVRRQGETSETFTDHTDVRPTLLHLAGLQDDYAHDGRVIVEALDGDVPQREIISRLAAAYKAINAPLGELGRRTLRISTRALSGDDATYTALETEITNLTAQRNAIAAQMIAILEAAAFNNAHVDEGEANDLIAAANQLIESVP